MRSTLQEELRIFGQHNKFYAEMWLEKGRRDADTRKCLLGRLLLPGERTQDNSGRNKLSLK